MMISVENEIKHDYFSCLKQMFFLSLSLSLFCLPVDCVTQQPSSSVQTVSNESTNTIRTSSATANAGNKHFVPEFVFCDARTLLYNLTYALSNKCKKQNTNKSSIEKPHGPMFFQA
jgi:hypothetical protein